MADFPFDLSKLDFSSMMGMARKLKEDMARLEESLGRITVESSVGGGMVTVIANGRGEVISLKIDPELTALGKKQMLEELVAAGVNQALHEARARRDEEMKRLTGGLNLPGFFA